MSVKTHLDLLGRKCEDKVTGFKGVITSINFDLYGCIQGLVKPAIDVDGKPQEASWFDVIRLKIKGTKPVMVRPNFDSGYVAKGNKGSADKPIP